MTEHKFGTWYPIAEVDDSWLDKDILLYEHGYVEKGFLAFAGGGRYHFRHYGYCGLDDTDPSHWMPLPPPPKEREKNEGIKNTSN